MKKNSINLLKERAKEPTLWENFYRWVSNTCRVIVIVTELLVLGAFGWRFILDRQLKDNMDEIKSYESSLKFLQADEENIRARQDQFVTYNALWAQSSDISSVLDNVNKLVPSNISKLSVTLLANQITISGETTDDDIVEMEKNFNDSRYFTNKQLSKFETVDDEEGAKRSFSFVVDVASPSARGSIISEL